MQEPWASCPRLLDREFPVERARLLANTRAISDPRTGDRAIAGRPSPGGRDSLAGSSECTKPGGSPRGRETRLPQIHVTFGLAGAGASAELVSAGEVWAADTVRGLLHERVTVSVGPPGATTHTSTPFSTRSRSNASDQGGRRRREQAHLRVLGSESVGGARLGQMTRTCCSYGALRLAADGQAQVVAAGSVVGAQVADVPSRVAPAPNAAPRPLVLAGSRRSPLASRVSSRLLGQGMYGRGWRSPTTGRAAVSSRPIPGARVSRLDRPLTCWA